MAAYKKATTRSAAPPKPTTFSCLEKRMVRLAYKSGYEKAVAATRSVVAHQLPVVTGSGQRHKNLDHRAVTNNADTESAPPKTATSGAEKRQKRSVYRDAYVKAVSKSADVQPQQAVPVYRQGQKLSAYRNAYEKATTVSVAPPKPGLTGVEKRWASLAHRSAYKKAVNESAAPQKKLVVSEAEKRQKSLVYRDAYERAITKSELCKHSQLCLIVDRDTYNKATTDSVAPSSKPVLSGSKGQCSHYRTAYEQAVAASTTAEPKPVVVNSKQGKKWSTYRVTYEKAVTESAALPRPVAPSGPVRRQSRSVYRDMYEKAVTESVVAPVVSGTGQSESSYKATREKAESVATAAVPYCSVDQSSFGEERLSLEASADETEKQL